MPYQAVIPAGPRSATSSATTHSGTATTPSPTSAHPIRVIPGVDVVLGTVTLMVGGGLVRYRHPEARLIARALAQAVRPTRWCQSTLTLTVTVAAVGKSAGIERHFGFSHPEGPKDHSETA
ncbi:hypothetical protein ACIQC5_04640 [Paenarthrobacter sp. NPDC092416]|uniref:hypothetical protein n=1 Tax=Paenarthrobacter sp. NPDC092416 TaxID=3364386 RepID=UPI003801872F